MISQNDSIVLKDKSILRGEIKQLSQGVLTMSTSYSDKDFQIEFKKVTSIKTERKSLIILTGGRRRFGYLTSDGKGGVTVIYKKDVVEHFKLNEVVALNEVFEKFWNRLSGSIDFGVNLSKANNFKQYNLGGNIKYTDQSFLFTGNINIINSSQSNAVKTQRTDAKIDLLKFLKKNNFAIGNLSFLQNTEQAIHSRINPSIGMGRFLVNTNKYYFGISISYTYNIENYVDSSLNKTSSEALLSATFYSFGFQNIDIDTSLNIYPSLSEKKRIRTDFDINLKYDLPFDFYIKSGLTINYDNQPAVNGRDTDYIFTTGFGWEFN
jgi:hypothetical protein